MAIQIVKLCQTTGCCFLFPQANPINAAGDVSIFPMMPPSIPSVGISGRSGATKAICAGKNVPHLVQTDWFAREHLQDTMV